MSWSTPILLTRDEWSVAAHLLADVTATRAASGASAPAVGLGSARAASEWAWAEGPTRPARPVSTPARVAAQGSCVRAPADVLARMSAAAEAQGRSESDVWVEAAREWLRRREVASVTPPVASAPPVAVARRVARVWDTIDALLVELRSPTASDHDDAPAA